MERIYNLCKTAIEKGLTDGLQDKLDVYLLRNRLTTEEYEKLSAMLAS